MSGWTTGEAFKPVLCELIQFYMGDCNHGEGGNLHIALSDGNLNESDLWHCITLCRRYDDNLGELIALVMRNFTEEELEALYDDDWLRDYL